jgi:hypothetical protein
MNTLKNLKLIMVKIKKYKHFISEEVSGTELVGPVGPAYGETRLQNKTVNKSHTSVYGTTGHKNPDSKNELTDDLFFEDDYNQIHNNFLKSGGSQSDLTGNREEDTAFMLNFLQEN